MGFRPSILVGSLSGVWSCALVACVSAPARLDAKALPELPTEFQELQDDTEPSPAALDPDWWTQLGDPQLDALIAEALEKNYDLEAASHRVLAAAAQARQSGALSNPSLDFGLNAARDQNVFVGLPIPGVNNVLARTSDTFAGNFSVSWEVDLWGRLAAAERADLAELAASQADQIAMRLSVAGQTATHWIQVVEVREQRDLARRGLASFRDSERFVAMRYANGVSTALDLRLAESQSANAAATLAGLERDLRSAQRALELVLGRYPAAEMEAAGPLPTAPADVPVGLPMDLLARRPDLVAAEQRLLSLESRSEALRADLYPRLALTGNYGRISDELSDLLDGDFSVWGLAAALAQPILDGGRRRAGIEASDASLSVARARFAGTLLQACAEVERALDAKRNLSEQIGYLAAAQQAARRAEALSDSQYREGLITIVTLLESQRSHFDAQGRLITAKAELLRAHIELVSALGGGYLGDGADADAGDSA